MAKKNTQLAILPDETIINKIYFLRGEKVMLDRDLAEMYGVSTKVLNQSVKRNEIRFPEDFMFQLTQDEFDSLMSQFVTSKGRGGTRKLPYAFTEQGVAMLSSVLHSPVAIEVNIRIIRVFTRMRQMLSTQKDIQLKLEQFEKELSSSTKDIATIFQVLKKLLTAEEKSKRRVRIGFKLPVAVKQNSKPKRKKK